MLSDMEAAWTWLRTVVEGIDTAALGQVYAVPGMTRPLLSEECAPAASVLGALAEVAVTTFAERTGLLVEEVWQTFDAALPMPPGSAGTASNVEARCASDTQAAWSTLRARVEDLDDDGLGQMSGVVETVRPRLSGETAVARGVIEGLGEVVLATYAERKGFPLEEVREEIAAAREVLRSDG